MFTFLVFGVGGMGGGVQSLSGFLGYCDIKTPKTHSGESLISLPLFPSVTRQNKSPFLSFRYKFGYCNWLLADEWLKLS